MSKSQKVVLAVLVTLTLSVIVYLFNNEGARRWITGKSVHDRDLVLLPNGSYAKVSSLQRDSNGNFIPPAGTVATTATPKWIPAEVHEIPFHPVPGAIAGQTMGKIVVPAGQEIVIFEGLTSEWNLAVWYNTSSTNLVIEETYNGTTTASAKASVKKVPEPPPHLDQVWSLSVFVPTNQSPNDLTVGWRLSRK